MIDPLQNALDAIGGAVSDDLSKAKARGLMRGYHAKWESSDWVTEQVEESFQLPIINPETGRSSRTFTYGGVRDGLARYVPSDKTWLRELKTCSEDIEDPDAPYWRRLEIDAQVSLYVLSQWQEGFKVAGTMYDVIRKPGIRPKEIARAMRQQIVAVGTYCGQRVSPEVRREIASGTERETPELFEYRLTADCIQESARYFQRRSIPRMDSELHEFALELWDTADEIRETRLKSRHVRNSGACMQWGRPCVYLPLCSGHDNPESEKWTRRERVHEEVDGEGDGRDMLTHSSMSTFKTCRRKYHYRYDLGIERVEPEDVESLHFGTLIHEAVGAYWNALRCETTNEEQESLANM